jgi:hypothetical protein
MRAAAPALVTLMAAGVTLAAPGCRGQTIDLKQSIQILDPSTGWFDAGIERGKNKLVPSVTFRLRNVGTAPVRGVQLNSVFRVIGDQQELGSTYVRAVADAPLEPGQTSKPYAVRCQFGYTGEEPRAQMLKNSLFKDAKVEVFGKLGSTQWVRLGEYTIERRLLTE